MNYSLIATAVVFCSVNLSTAQTAAVDNKPAQTITFRPIPKGPTVLGVFEGRPPCQGLAKELKLSVPADCEKLKSALTLYRDPETLQPTTYALIIVGVGDIIKHADGSFHQEKLLKGKWMFMKGSKSNPHATIYGLELGTGAYLYLLKGDENVLFILDENKEFIVGNENYSYTLNRVELVAGKK